LYTPLLLAEKPRRYLKFLYECNFAYLVKWNLTWNKIREGSLGIWRDIALVTAVYIYGGWICGAYKGG
jgi:hypothetical protein